MRTLGPILLLSAALCACSGAGDLPPQAAGQRLLERHHVPERGAPGSLKDAVYLLQDRIDDDKGTAPKVHDRMAEYREAVALLQRAPRERPEWYVGMHCAVLYETALNHVRLRPGHREPFDFALLEWPLSQARLAFLPLARRLPASPRELDVTLMSGYYSLLGIAIRSGKASDYWRREALRVAAVQADAGLKWVQWSSQLPESPLAGSSVATLFLLARTARDRRESARLLAQAREILLRDFRARLERGVEGYDTRLIPKLGETVQLLPEELRVDWTWEVCREIRALIDKESVREQASNPVRAIRLQLLAANMDYSLTAHGVDVQLEAVLAEAEALLGLTPRLPQTREGDLLRGQLLRFAGHKYSMAGAFPRAYELILASLAYPVESPQDGYKTYLLLAECALAMGRLAEAEGHSQRAREQAAAAVRASPEGAGVYFNDNDLVELNVQLLVCQGDLRGALEVARTALSSLANATWRLRWMQHLARITGILDPGGAESRQYLENFCREARNGGDLLIEEWICEARAELARINRDYAAVAVQLELAIRAARNRQTPWDVAYFQWRLGKLRLDLKKPDAARRHFEEALKYSRENAVAELEWQALFGLGMAAEREGKYEAALKLYERAADLGERLRIQAGSPESQARSLPDFAEVFGRAAQISITQGRPRQALKWSRRYHAQLLHRQLIRMGDSPKVELKTKSAAEARDAEARLELGRLLLRKMSLPHGACPPELGRRIAAARAATRAAKQAMRVELARLPDLNVPTETSVSLPDLQRLAARQGAAMLEYLVVDDGVQLFVITGRDFFHRFLRIPRAELTALIGNANEACATPWSDEALGIRQQLYKTLIDPIADDLEPGQPLVIVADGVLSDVPWATLCGPDRRLLLEQHYPALQSSLDVYDWVSTGGGAVRALVCARDYAGGPQLLSASRSSQKDSLAHLPGALREAAAVCRELGGSERFQAAATRAAILRGLGAGLVWYIGHTEYAEDDPAQCALVLAGPQGHDRFRLHELLRLFPERLENLQMVVMSSCESAKGQVAAGEGPLSLAWAFQRAGARTVVACRWKVEDEATRVLMTAYARNLKTMDRLRALQTAQVAVMNDPNHPQWRHPYYWAAPVLYGRTDRLQLIPNNPLSARDLVAAVIAALLCLLAVGVMVVRCRHKVVANSAPASCVE